MCALRTNSIEPANRGSEDYFLTRAWVTVSGASATILNDGNVSSVTDNGVGAYTANFSRPLSSANFSKAVTANYLSSATSNADGHYYNQSTSSVSYGAHGSGSNTLYDCNELSLTVTG